MITNKIKIKGNKKFKDFEPVGKQKKFLRENFLAGKIEKKEQGENYNGYGYKDKVRYYTLTRSQYTKLLTLVDGYVPPKRLTFYEKKEKWEKRLVKLLDGRITLEDAQKIAEEKIEYKEQQIENLEERQGGDGYSWKRRGLINQIKRSNPLRYIEDEDHALSILYASKRHKETNYEKLLEEGRELMEQKKQGEYTEYDSAKEYARKNYQHN